MTKRSRRWMPVWAKSFWAWRQTDEATFPPAGRQVRCAKCGNVWHQSAPVTVAEPELAALNNLVEQYLIFAEGQAMRRIPMHMADWTNKLDGFLTLNDRDILTHAGRISHEMALAKAELEYGKFKELSSADRRQVDTDFERAVNTLPKLTKAKKPRKV